ncbi:MAG: Xaa-Pro peptidase family protein [Rhizobiaceae bacterium]|nr:Xaa-Pro peptidase family protein [Rhizobiaceae bacterium]
MALHFNREEFAARMNRLKASMNAQNLDGMLLFAQESMFWLTGYDTFGYCFFQCMVISAQGDVALLTRAPDLRQAQHTSIVENIIIWKDEGNADPTRDLEQVVEDMRLQGKRLGVEYDTQGLTGKAAMAINARIGLSCDLVDASDLVTDLRMIKSDAELEYVRKAGELSDAALDAAIATTKAGAFEGDILAAMHNAIFSKGGDYAGNEFIIGSGKDALLCRYKSGRRHLSENDQLTLEWSGAWARYHAAMMRTLIIGQPTARHQELYEASKAALLAVKMAMKTGNTFSDMFHAHAKAMDDVGLSEHRLNACGYSLGAVYTPCWMNRPMIFSGNETRIVPGMVIFGHMIIFDSKTETAMTLGQSFITTDTGPEDLSRHDVDLIVC